MPSGWLVVKSTSGVRRVPLEDTEQTLGRDPSNDVVIDDAFVSRRHARLVWRDGLPTLIDAGSAYGLREGGRAIGEGVLAPGRVVEIRGPRAGDVIELSYQPEAGAGGVNRTFAEPPPERHALTGPPTGFLRLPAGDQRVSIGRAPQNDVVLDHPQVSLVHAICSVGGAMASLVDQSTNGTFVNGERVVGQRTLQNGDRIRIASFELMFEGGRLVQYDQTRRARLDALHLCRVLDDGASILHDVTFSALPRDMIAIVGASGAGKSTLMDALNGYRPATTGSVLVNGRDYYREFAALRLLMGYVPQSDVVHRELTPERALDFAAHLRLPSDTAKAERATRVQAVLEEVDLTDRQHVPIVQLSGGQIKRVSIGVELLTRPSLFFLDEPTSGLDPGYEQRIMELLRSLANQGRTVMLITHATQNIELCDHVACMAPGGYLAYFGPPRLALPYFDCTGYPGIYGRLHQEDGEALASRFRQHQAYREHVQARLPDTPAIEVAAAPAAVTAPADSPLPAWRQFTTLVHRYLETIVLDQRNLYLLLLQAPIIGFMAIFIAKPNIFTALPDANDSRGLLVVLSCSMIWLGTINAAREIVKELPVYRRERMVGLGILPYLASKYVVLGALCLLQAAMLLGIVGLRARITADGLLLPGPLELYATLVFAAAAGLAAGLAISTLFNNADRASALVPYLLIPQIIFVVVNLDGPSQVLSWLTISHWSVQALGASVNLAQFSSALTGLDPADYPHTANFLLSRWLILLTMTAVFTLASLLLLKRHDGNLLR